MSTACNAEGLIGLPDDTILVNYNDGDFISGTFGAYCTDKTGIDLLFESSFNIHTYSYKIRLKYNQGLYTSVKTTTASGWNPANRQFNSYEFNYGCEVENIPSPVYYYTMDFSSDFNLGINDTVKGIEITFSGSDPDLGGIYIVQCNGINLGSDTTLCNDKEVITLNAAIPNSRYLWSNQSVTSSISINQPGTYWVQVDGICGRMSDTIRVNYDNLSLFTLGNDSIICGEQQINIKLSCNPSYNYIWDNNTTLYERQIESPGKYWVNVSDKFCNYSDTIRFNKIILDLGKDISFCSSQPVQLSPDIYNASYHWMDGSDSPFFSPSVTGKVTLTVEAQKCTLNDSVFVQVRDCEIGLEMPNVFSPNNDGINDLFLPIKYKRISEASMTIFNRWGEMIFSTTDLKSGWNGKRNDKEFSDGTYLYVVKYTTEESENKSIVGYLQLVK